MITFKQYITEELTPKIHYNIGVEKMKAITKNSVAGEARFVVDQKGRLHGADANDFCHDDFCSDRQIMGMMTYKNNTYKFGGVNMRHSSAVHPKDWEHPITNKFEKAGIHSSKYNDLFTESEYEDILSNQRQKEGLQAALKDPETNKIYVGKSHQDAYNSAPPDAQKRLYSYIDMRTKNFSRTSIAGFVNDKGRWQTRRETEKSHGADHAEGLKALGHIKEMILESFAQEKIHKNPSLESLKNIVAGAGNKYRFITTKKGDL